MTEFFTSTFSRRYWVIVGSAYKLVEAGKQALSI